MGSTGFLMIQPRLMAKLNRVASSRFRLFQLVGWPAWHVSRASRIMAGVMAAHGLATRSGQRRSRRPRRVFRDSTVTRLLCAFAVLRASQEPRNEWRPLKALPRFLTVFHQPCSTYKHQDQSFFRLPFQNVSNCVSVPQYTLPLPPLWRNISRSVSPCGIYAPG